MRAREAVRSKARELRATLLAGDQSILDKLRALLWDEHGIELVAVEREHFLQEGRGEIVPAEGCLYYARDLETRPDELLEVVAHEYAHLVLHHTEFGRARADLIRGSVFLDSGTAALSRYSPRSRAEAEASAFAAEFICPSAEAFSRWRSTHGITLTQLATEYGATPQLVRQQLAEGLHALIAGTPSAADDAAQYPASEAQESAATVCGMPVLVDAGPGTGKTRTLVRRIEFLLNQKQVQPERLLVLTFSNEAANELQERIHATLGQDLATRILATTFHGFGLILLHALGHHVGVVVDFSVVDEICQEELVADIIGQVDCEALLDIKNPTKTAAEVVRTINFLKDRLISPAQLEAAIAEWPPDARDDEELERARALSRVYQRYEATKTERGQVDFADLIGLPQQILAEHSELRHRLRSEFAWVLVDEYQDVSRSTAILLGQLCGSENPPWVVGDARQAIYRFRGAAPENVKEFSRDFPGAQRHELTDNYRSAAPIISLVNRLAASLENQEYVAGSKERWRPASTIVPFGAMPARLAEATSDVAEREGIVREIGAWLESGAKPSEIAVLARRNVDVRNIAIALNTCGVRAVTSGLLTAEGAGGDIAAVLAAVDHQQALPRVLYAVYRGLKSQAVLNAAAAQLLRRAAEDDVSPFSGSDEVQSVATEAWRLFRDLRGQLHSADGWNILCDFLFFFSEYARRLVDSAKDPVSMVQLEEVLSGLALAAHYRFSHLHVQPRRSRLGLSERFRSLVTQPTPGLVSPRADLDAVRVMTCHAAKGLEFPFVAVAGQSLADVPPPKPSLPPQLRPTKDDDELQAESLLFVGVSRAQRSVIVSYATSATGTPRSRRRRFPKLLTTLRESGALPLLKWDAPLVAAEDITIGRVWGGEPPSDVSTYALGAETCRVRTYLEEQLGVRFRGRIRPLYPEFVDRVRRMLRRVVLMTIASGQRPTRSQVNQIVDEEWPQEHRARHPHVDLYRPRARDWAQTLAGALNVHELRGATSHEEPFEWQDSSGVTHVVKLQLIAHLTDSAGDRIVVALQPKATKSAVVNWSELDDYQRLPFVLLHQRHGDVQPFVFSGSDGELRPFRWRKSRPDVGVQDQATQARQAFLRVMTGEFDGRIDDWICDRCSARTLCPWWLGAV